MNPSTDTHKRCGKCQQWKTLEQFNKDRTTASGLYGYCRECQRKKVRYPQKPKDTTACCKTCGKEFTYDRTHSGRRKYCSTECRPKRKSDPQNTLHRKCPVCDKAFTCWKSNPTVTCSSKCYGKLKSPDAKGKSHCPECGKEFEWYASLPRKYCSRECAGKNTISNISRWEATAYETMCEQCGDIFTTTPARTNGRFCCFDCWKEWFKTNAPTGESHSLFKGGYKGQYYGPNWHAQRRKARSRDGYVCQHCGIAETRLKRALDVHHIKPFRECRDYKEANRLSNLICLCTSCHKKAEHKKISLQPHCHSVTTSP